MACPIDAKEIEKLKMFVQFCSMSPHILHRPELSFFKKFIEQMGGTVPEEPKPHPQSKPEPSKPAPEQSKPSPAAGESSEEDAEEEEPEPEIDREGCVDEPDTEEPHEMGDATKEPSEEDIDKANELRGKAQALFSERKFDEAIDLYTEAILLNPNLALFFAKRGQCFLKTNKPNACIRDCNAALEKNPDSAAAYKFRGRAHRLLGNWQESARDLRQACKIDFDEETDEWLREVTPKAHLIEQFRIDRERRQNEREIKAKIKRNQKAREAHRRAAEEEKATGGGAGMGGGMPGGAGGFPFGNMGGMQGMFDDPEIQKVMMEILSDPSKLAQYAADPKYKPLFDMMGMMGGGGAGGAPGGMPFSFGGAGGPDDATAEDETATEAEEPKKPAPKASNLSDDLD